MAYDPASLDKPFEILKAFDWGGDASAFQPIDAAVVVAHADPAAATALVAACPPAALDAVAPALVDLLVATARSEVAR